MSENTSKPTNPDFSHVTYCTFCEANNGFCHIHPIKENTVDNRHVVCPIHNVVCTDAADDPRPCPRCEQENNMPYDPEKDTDPIHMEDHYNGDGYSIEPRCTACNKICGDDPIKDGICLSCLLTMPDDDVWTPGDQLPGGCSISEYSNEVDWEPVICKVCGHALSDDEDVCPKAKIKCGNKSCTDGYHHTVDEVKTCFNVPKGKVIKRPGAGDYFEKGRNIRKIKNPHQR